MLYFPNHGTSCHDLSIIEKLSMSKVASTWFEIVWTFGVEAIDYWTIFSIKLNEIKTENYIGIWGVLGVIENPLMSKI